MAGPAKKRILQQNSSQSQNNQSDEGTQEVVNADFQGRNIEVVDCHGIEQLLRQLFMKVQINVGQLAEIIIAHNEIGSVLTQYLEYDAYDDDDDDETIFGVITVVNVSNNQNYECLQELKTKLLDLAKKYASESVENKFKSLFSEHKKIGFLINERFLNISAKVADPLLTSLQKEINKTSDKYDYYIMISKLYKESKDENASIVMYANAEEEVFVDSADASFDYPVFGDSDAGAAGAWDNSAETVIPFRTALIFSADKFPKIVEDVKNFIA